MDGRCAICREEFDDDQKIPRLIPTCGLSYCQKCLVEAQQEADCYFECPVDRQIHSLIVDINSLPVNIALIKTLGDLKTIAKKEESFSKSIDPLTLSYSYAEEKCQTHGKTKQFLCKQDNQFVCSYCILFGEHKNHQIQNVSKNQNKEKMDGLFQKIQKSMIILDGNIKEFLQPPNSFVRNLQSLKKSLKWEVKKVFKVYHDIISQKQQSLQNEVDQILKYLHLQMQDVADQLNIQYNTICNIKQQINSLKIDVDSQQQSSFTFKKTQDLLNKIFRTSDFLVKMNEEVTERCQEIQEEYKSRINQRQFIVLKQLTATLKDQDHEQQNLLENNIPNLPINNPQNKQFINTNSRHFSQIQKSPRDNKFNMSPPKPSVFATQVISQTQIDVLPQISLLQLPSKNKQPLTNRQTRNISEIITKVQQDKSLGKSYISPTSPIKNLNRYNSALVQSNSGTLILKNQSTINRSKIQFLKDKQEKRLVGKQEVKKKLMKILESIQSQRGTTLQLIGMEIKDYFINEIFGYIKKSNRKYGLIKLVKNQITDEGFQKILNHLKSYEYTYTLNMTSNVLTEECLDKILEFKDYNKSLKNFYLNNNQINHIRTKQKKKEISEAGINLFC